MKKTIAALGISALTLCAAPNAVADSYIPILSFAAGLLNQGVFPQSSAYTTDDDITILADDGVNLEANIFVPTSLQGTAPAVVFINSWALNEYEYLSQAADLAERGYIVLSYSTRGFGTSGGLIDTAGPKDIADLSTVLDHLIANYPVNPDAIAVGGISYGSGISLIGAAHDDRIKAVAALSSWGSLVESLYGNQTPRLVWGELLNISSQLIGRPDPIVSEYWTRIKNQDLAGLQEVINWSLVRSPSTYTDMLNDNNTAVYLAKAYGDDLFQPNSLLDMFSELSGPKHIDLVSGTHATAELLPSLLGIGEDRIWNNVYDWFDLHLKGTPNAMATAAPVSMKVKFKDQYDNFSGWPIPQGKSTTWYLHPRNLFSAGDLKTSTYSSLFSVDNSINAWAGTLFSTQVPLLSQLLEQIDIGVYADISAASDVRSIHFDSSTLSQTMKIRGEPSVSLQIQPHHSKVQLVAYLYDVDFWGTGRLITHGVKTLPATQSGLKQTINFEMVTTAYDVPAGHRVVLAIDTTDPQYKAPTSTAYNLDFEFNRSRQSSLKIPHL